MGLKLFMEGGGMQDMNSRIVRVEVSRHELIDSGFGRHLRSEVRICSGGVCAEEEGRPVPRGTWFRLFDFFVILFDFFFMVGEIVLDFGDLRRRSVTRTLFFKHAHVAKMQEVI
jgi:hypothetical protein